MIVRCENCQIEVGLVYEQTCEVITGGLFEGWMLRMGVRVWPKI